MSYLQQQIASLLRSAVIQAETEPYYEVLQYITLDGTQYFNTGYYGNTINTSADFRISVDSFDSNSGICGSRNDTTATESSMCILFLKGPVTTSTGTHQNSLRLDWVSGDGTTFTSSLTLGGETTVTCTSNKAVINGTSYTSTGTRNYDQNNPFYIGTVCSGSGTAFTPGLNGKIYVFKIFESGVLVHDYVPVLDFQMRPCLYDKVDKTFLYAKKVSDGTTTYDLGFKRWNKYDVDYIASSGTQYIDTGYAFADNFSWELDFADLIGTSSTLFGGRTSSARTALLYNNLDTVLSGEITCPIAGLNGSQTPFRLGLYSNSGRHKVKMSVASNKASVWVDDTTLYDNQSFTGTYISGTTQALFGDNFGGTTGVSELATAKVYGLTMWQGTKIVRDLKPSVRTYNDGTNVVTKAFMYDEVYNKAYDNAGTGSFKAYIQPRREVYNLAMHDTMDINGFYLAEDGTKTVSSDGTSCYTEAIQVKEGDIIEWTVTAEAVAANKRIHGYTTDADITTGQKGSWVEMLAKIVFSTTSDTTQTARFTVPSGINYIRMSHANVRESKDSIVRIRTYEVGKAIKYPANNGFTLDAPNSSNFILDLLTRATTSGSYYILDTRYQTGSNSEDEFGIGGSSTGATVNWKCEAESNLVKTNGTNWNRTSQNYTYSQMLVGYKDGNTFKRTAVFYDFNNQKISDIEVVTATRDIANNTKPLTILHTTSSNWLQNGAEIYYFKYLQDGNDVWYDCIPVRNATVTSSLLLFDKVHNTSLPNTGSGTPTFVALD